VLGVDLPFGPPKGPGPHALRRIDGQNTRLADRYRERNVFLVADAAREWADRVDVVTAAGTDAPADALLIRPDGYVAWAADGPDGTGVVRLRQALGRWFGPAGS
jgi:hypothetical protein